VGVCGICFDTNLCGATGEYAPESQWGDEEIVSCSIMGNPVGDIGSSCCDGINVGAVAIVTATDHPATSAAQADEVQCAPACQAVTVAVLEFAGAMLGISGIIEPFEQACEAFAGAGECVDADPSTWPEEAAPVASMGGCGNLAQAATIGLTCDTDLSTDATVQSMAPGISGTFREYAGRANEASEAVRTPVGGGEDLRTPRRGAPHTLK